MQIVPCGWCWHTRWTFWNISGPDCVQLLTKRPQQPSNRQSSEQQSRSNSAK
jgi:hypothetical protein